MIQFIIVVAIIALAVLIYFKNRVENRRIDRINRLAEKQEELLDLLKENKTDENEN